MGNQGPISFSLFGILLLESMLRKENIFFYIVISVLVEHICGLISTIEVCKFVAGERKLKTVMRNVYRKLLSGDNFVDKQKGYGNVV